MGQSSLEKRVALVVGGATRLGRAISLALAGAGADVGIGYLRSDKQATETANEIRARGRRAQIFRCDVRDPDSIAAMVGGAKAALGPIDLLVVNAGVFRRTPIETATVEDWDSQMETNARGAFLCAQRVGLEMRERGGAIVLISDVAGLRPWSSYIPYSASKAAMISITQGLAQALAPKVRVNAIAPGPVLPPEDFDEEEVRRAIARTLLRRQGDANDIATAVLYLATAEYVTGVVLPVDGGRHLT
jgi:NAD(P)-dependent dehydrogenase (short-subunit alcohol dehydrogenase family)